MSQGIGDVVRFWGGRLADHPAIRAPGREITWSQFDVATDELAAGFSQAGVDRGDVVAILLGNRVEFLETMIAVMKIGAVVELLNTRLTPSELIHPVEDADAKVIVTERSLVDRLSLVRERNEQVRVLLTEELAGFDTLDSLRCPGSRPPDVVIAANDPALICYTSGTTGVPKGAILSHGSIRAGATNHAVSRPLTWSDRILHVMPLAFAGGAATSYLGYSVIPGATLVMPPDNDPETLLDVIERERITAWPSVTTICETVADHPKFSTTDLSSLRFVVAGGSPVSHNLLKVWGDRNTILTQGYGSTETSGQHACLLFEQDAARKLGTAGRPMMDVEMRVVDSEGHDVPVSKTGELLIKAPLLFSGYLKRPEETASSMKEGWFSTGDMAQIDEEGFISIVDRLKDMIISGGLNVYPAEIERTLSRKAGLGQFAVIGVPDKRWGEVPMIVVEDIGSVELKSLRETCNQELADYKRPRYLLQHDGEFPRTMSGKILKKVLHEMYPEVPEGAVDLKAQL